MDRHLPPLFCRDCNERFEPVDRDERSGQTVETRCQTCQAQWRIKQANQRHHLASMGMQTEKPLTKGIW